MVSRLIPSSGTVLPGFMCSSLEYNILISLTRIPTEVRWSDTKPSLSIKLPCMPLWLYLASLQDLYNFVNWRWWTVKALSELERTSPSHSVTNEALEEMALFQVTCPTQWWIPNKPNSTRRYLYSREMILKVFDAVPARWWSWYVSFFFLSVNASYFPF